MASTNLTGTTYNAYRSANGAITATPTQIPPLGPTDILIKLTHTGICYTDREFHRASAPLALGHEGAGVTIAVGPSVTSIKPGDRVGGGFHRDSCGHCKYCLTGNDIQCYSRVIFGEGDYDNGTFAPYYIGKETFVHKISEGMANEHAAPLQCAGATTYNALADTVKAGDRVGVVGIGGLGHLAIQFAAHMGAEVVVFSTSKDKEAEAKEFGASEFVLMNEPEKVRKPLDVLIVASNRYPDWSKFLTKNVLARGGTLVPLAAPMEGPISLPADRLFWDVYHVHSSLVASRARHGEMLEFAARHGVKPTIELSKHTGADSITKAIERLESGKVRYRLVLAFE